MLSHFIVSLSRYDQIGFGAFCLRQNTKRPEGRAARRRPGNVWLVGLQPTVIASRASPPLLEQSSRFKESWTRVARQRLVVGLQPTVIASRASPPLLEQRIVDARRPSTSGKHFRRRPAGEFRRNSRRASPVNIHHTITVHDRNNLKKQLST